MEGLSAAGITFVDTNVLVYAPDASETVKGPVARDALQRLWNDGTGALSTRPIGHRRSR